MLQKKAKGWVNLVKKQKKCTDVCSIPYYHKNQQWAVNQLPSVQAHAPDHWKWFKAGWVYVQKHSTQIKFDFLYNKIQGR